MFQPYSRVAIIHFVLIIGVISSIFLEKPLVTACALIFIKTVFDIKMHIKDSAASEKKKENDV